MDVQYRMPVTRPANHNVSRCNAHCRWVTDVGCLCSEQYVREHKQFISLTVQIFRVACWLLVPCTEHQVSQRTCIAIMIMLISCVQVQGARKGKPGMGSASCRAAGSLVPDAGVDVQEQDLVKALAVASVFVWACSSD